MLHQQADIFKQGALRCIRNRPWIQSHTFAHHDNYQKHLLQDLPERLRIGACKRQYQL